MSYSCHRGEAQPGEWHAWGHIPGTISPPIRFSTFQVDLFESTCFGCRPEGPGPISLGASLAIYTQPPMGTADLGELSWSNNPGIAVISSSVNVWFSSSGFLHLERPSSCCLLCDLIPVPGIQVPHVSSVILASLIWLSLHNGETTSLSLIHRDKGFCELI